MPKFGRFGWLVIAALDGILVAVLAGAHGLKCASCTGERCGDSISVPSAWDEDCENFCYAVYDVIGPINGTRVLARGCYNNTDERLDSGFLYVENEVLLVNAQKGANNGTSPGSDEAGKSHVSIPEETVVNSTAHCRRTTAVPLFEAFVRQLDRGLACLAVIVCHTPACNDISPEEGRQRFGVSSCVNCTEPPQFGGSVLAVSSSFLKLPAVWIAFSLGLLLGVMAISLAMRFCPQNTGKQKLEENIELGNRNRAGAAEGRITGGGGENQSLTT